MRSIGAFPLTHQLMANCTSEESSREAASRWRKDAFERREADLSSYRRDCACSFYLGSHDLADLAESRKPRLFSIISTGILPAGSSCDPLPLISCHSYARRRPRRRADGDNFCSSSARQLTASSGSGPPFPLHHSALPELLPASFQSFLFRPGPWPSTSILRSLGAELMFAK